MARPGLTRHRKFLRLARAIGGEMAAFGALGLMWESAYESGDDLLGDADDVEACSRWPGERGVLCAALLDAGFIDRDGDQYRVHDLWHHAPDYVQKRRRREAERRTKVDPVRSVSGQCPVNGEQLTVDQPVVALPPCSPLPAPSPCTREKSIVKRAARARGNAAPSLPWEDFSSMTDEALWARRIELAKTCGDDERLRKRFIACSHECLKRSGQAGSGGEA